MKRLIAVLMLLATGLFRTAHAVVAEDDTFITLTRRPTPRASLPTNISVVTAKDIEESGARSLPDILDRLTGIDLSRSGSLGSFTSIRMRGANTADQIQIVVDDQPIGGISVQNINLDLLPLDDIERIEVVRGGSSVLYGANTIGGVVHIFTKRYTNDQAETELGYEMGSLHTRINRAKAGIKTDRVGGGIFLGNYLTDGYQKNADVRNRDNSGNLSYFFENGASVGADVSYTDRELGSPNGTPVPMDQWDGKKELEPNSTAQRVENKSGRARVKGVMPIGHLGSLQTSIYHSRETYKLRLSPGIVDPLATFDNRITGQDTRLMTDQGTTVGVAYERNERYSQGQVPRHIVNWGTYLQQEATWKKLILIPAIRFDQHSAYGNQWNPRLTAVYKAKENLNFSANAARAYRSPTLVDLYIVATDPFFPAFDFFGNPNLKPETATTYDAGMWSKLGNFEVSVTGFYTRLRDRIDTVDTDGNGNVDTLRNFSKAETRGVELESHFTSWRLRHSANLTLQRPKGTSITSSQFVPLRLTPRYLCNYQLGMPLPGKFDLVNTVQAAGHQYELDNKGGVRLPSYTIWHARLSREIRQVNAFFSVQNILDKRYAESVTFGNGVPQPGRTYWGGLEIKIP